ncbi:hypothetical protein AB0D47_39910 [Streptomyces sp. NPDC048376]|uniref:hypothetical protein n=1 Tax=unclassified Streptomyces TaxID=2593676 RepID=UPI0034294F4A
MPRDSGRVSGNMCRPRRYHRGLLRASYRSARAGLKTTPPPRLTTDARGTRERGTSRPYSLWPPADQRLVSHAPRRSVLKSPYRPSQHHLDIVMRKFFGYRAR